MHIIRGLERALREERPRSITYFIVLPLICTDISGSKWRPGPARSGLAQGEDRSKATLREFSNCDAKIRLSCCLAWDQYDNVQEIDFSHPFTSEKHIHGIQIVQSSTLEPNPWHDGPIPPTQWEKIVLLFLFIQNIFSNADLRRTYGA
jgi:hypothetical protein